MNELIKKLDASILAGRALHAYLITGNDPDVTASAARRAAAMMLYSAPLVERLKLDPDHLEYSGSISISDFRDVIRPEIYRETYSKAGRVVIFGRADQLSQMVQNAMLKVLEEPPENTHFILTGNEYGILPTIRSRCMILRCSIPEASEVESILISHGANADEAAKYAIMSGCISARAIRLFEDEGFREFRNGAINGLFSAIKGSPDFRWTKQKRDRSDWAEANEMLLIVCHDLMNAACGLAPDHNTDRAAEITNLSKSFTIGDIGCIIEKLTELSERLASNSSGAAAFDRFFTEVALIANTKHNLR